MVLHRAACIYSASARAWINTFVSMASLVGWTVRVDHTLGSASHIGIPKVFRDAAARSSTISRLANGIAATRRRIARIHINCGNGRC